MCVYFQACSSQSDSLKAYLRQRYPADKLYTVTQAVGASQPMDLELAPGVLVGVSKETDPMGNKEHWFVDAGGVCYWKQEMLLTGVLCC